MDERLANSCQRALNEKCSNQYEGVDHLWLGIYGDAPVTESHEFDLVIQKLTIPSVNPFERIFLLHRITGPAGGYRALQISPFVHEFLSY
jgi:hypothetical protein